MINASSSQSNTFPKITAAVIDMVFQEELLANPELNEDDGPIKKVRQSVQIVRRNPCIPLTF
jgi:hypothetical protein